MHDRPLISVILPTIRPALIEACLKNLVYAAAGLPVEVIVVADFQAPVPHEPWIVRERLGVIDAVHVGYAQARGEYVFLTNDETRCEVGLLAKLYAAGQLNPNRLMTPRHLPYFPFVYYGRPFAAFPFAQKTFLDSIGGLLDPAFKAFYADPDLSMRAHAAGYPVDVIHDAVIHHANNHDAAHQASVDQYLAGDRATFRSRWDHLGVFCDP